MTMIDAVLAALQAEPPPVLTDYALGRLVYRAHQEASGSIPASVHDYRQVLHFLLGHRIARNLGRLPEGRAMLLIGQRDPEPFTVLCCLDPFGYVSHLSAMEYHGLTDRLSKTIYFTTPPAPEWTQMASARMRRDLGEAYEGYVKAGMPRLRRLVLKRLDRRPIEYHHRRTAGGYRLAAHGAVRVASLGRTWLEMLQDPDRCGGLQHVIEVFRERARDHLRLILAELERHGSEIDRARAGYLLEEHAGIQDPVLDAWQRRVQRGGSRKLCAHAEYSPRYSERWCLSLNHE
jgi:hypothetical protein